MAQRHILSDIADRVTGPTPWAVANLRYAHTVTETLFNVSYVDFVHREELIAILGHEHASDALVWDTGARRHVVRSRSRFIKGSIKPCTFTIRGVNAGGKQPECMGDVVEFLPLRGGTVVKCVLQGAVLLKDAPHDIIGACLLSEAR